jgi:hypothetical protein
VICPDVTQKHHLQSRLQMLPIAINDITANQRVQHLDLYVFVVKVLAVTEKSRITAYPISGKSLTICHNFPDLLAY